MAFLKLYRKKLQENYSFLDIIFKERDIEWGVVTKLLCGNTIYLKEIINLGVTEIHDSRVSNLRKVKKGGYLMDCRFAMGGLFTIPKLRD